MGIGFGGGCEGESGGRDRQRKKNLNADVGGCTRMHADGTGAFGAPAPRINDDYGPLARADGAAPLSPPSWPALGRPSTSFVPACGKDVDGRAKPRPSPTMTM